MYEIQGMWQEILSKPAFSLTIIGNLILIESLLSVDNAAVLATMVMDLPQNQRSKALKYGIWGAYIFRGLAMLFASLLIQIWWLKPIGGLYLLYLVWEWWQKKQTPTHQDILIKKENKWFYKITKGLIGSFWATVVSVEIMDLAFSIDNVFAVVAFSHNLILIYIGVFIGILAMRYIANRFVKLMEKFPYLETSAFMVILILGLKLLMSVYEHFYPQTPLCQFLQSHYADIGISILTVGIFFLPIIFQKLYKKN